jgi:VanZ family protein
MVSKAFRPASRIALRVPVIFLVLATTIIPVELRPPGRAPLSFSIEPFDVAANIAGFVPVGIVLRELGVLWSILIGALISIFAEGSQFFIAYRDPSVVDVAANTIGAIIGTVISVRWKLRSPAPRMERWMAAVAALAALAAMLGVWATSPAPLSARGSTAPGILEAHWTFDEAGGDVALDSSGHELLGRFRNQTRRGAGVRGGAVVLDGVKDYVEFDRSSALRLTGSMTITAWINSRSFPIDDAAIVSTFQSGAGYQLDTTVDRKLRGIGFKLTNACGELMARYGATPLHAGVWYHVAGVYDAGGRTLDVYLNGRPDDGFLLGPVTGSQRASRAAIAVGRRKEHRGFEFAGSIDDVRIYSFALTKDEVAADMAGKVINRPAQRTVERAGTELSTGRDAACRVLSEYEDAKMPGVAGVIGALVAVSVVGLWPSGAPVFCLAASFAAGLLLLPFCSSTLPWANRWVIPLTSLAGGMAVAISVRRDRRVTRKGQR